MTRIGRRCGHLLADLVGRGLDATDGLLDVIDGAKALSAAVTAVFGASAAIQRCTVHRACKESNWWCRGLFAGVSESSTALAVANRVVAGIGV
jgi:hypothetical protein